MIIDNKEVSEEFIKQLMLKMGKEQEEENLNILKEKLSSINVPQIDLTYTEKMIKCLEYDVFDCFNIYGIRYYDLEEIQQNSDIQLTDDIISRDKDRIINFLLNIRDVVKIFKDYKIQEVKPINLEVEEVKEILC